MRDFIASRRIVCGVTSIFRTRRISHAELVLGNPVAEEIRTRASADTEAVIAALAAALHDAFGRDPGRMTLNAIVLQADRD